MKTKTAKIIESRYLLIPVSVVACGLLLLYALVTGVSRVRTSRKKMVEEYLRGMTGFMEEMR